MSGSATCWEKMQLSERECERAKCVKYHRPESLSNGNTGLACCLRKARTRAAARNTQFCLPRYSSHQ